jgi:hypothetical protein
MHLTVCGDGVDLDTTGVAADGGRFGGGGQTGEGVPGGEVR